MPTTFRIVMFAAATLGLAVLVLTQPTRGDNSSSPRLEPLRTLAGHWQGTSAENHEGMPDTVTVTYRVTSNNNVVVETFMPGTPHEMITVYYVDADKLVLTHYCALGNQPMMTAVEDQKPDSLRFVCHGGGNLPDENVPHMHEVTHEFLGPDHLRSSWVMLEDGKPAHTTVFDLHRTRQ